MDGDRPMGFIPIKEAESVLAQFPGVGHVTVVEQDSASAGQCLVAYVATSGPGLDVPALRAHARRLLPGHLVPAAVVVLDELPMAPDGTIDLAALPVPDLDGPIPYRAPANARQEILCALFAEALGVARCGPDADFFKLGGRSIDAMLLAGRIRTTLGIRISMADLFRAPTPGDLDRRLDLATSSAK
jgi:acyl carrier protein